MASNLNSGDLGYYESQQAGFYDYPSKVHDKFFVSKGELASRPVTVKEGQVLKARSLVESDETGKMIAANNFTEIALLHIIAPLVSDTTLIVDGLTITATGGDATEADIVQALLTGSTVGNAVITGLNISWSTKANPSSARSLYFFSNVMGIDVENLSVTGTGVMSPNEDYIYFIDTIDGSSVCRPPAGVLCFDVDATDGDVRASIWFEADLYAKGIVWGVDTSVDMVNVNGIPRACTPYNTGCYTELTQQRLLERNEINILHETLGEGATHG